MFALLFFCCSFCAIISLKSVADLIKLRDVIRVKGHDVYVRQVDQSNYYRVLEDLKMKEFFNIIVDIRPERMVDLLNVVIYCTKMSLY